MTPQAVISGAANGVFSYNCKPITDCTFQTETSLCDQAPEAAFSLYVISNFGTYLNAVSNAIDNVAGITDDASKNMQDTFKTKAAVSIPIPFSREYQLILIQSLALTQNAVGILNGILGALSVAMPAAGVAAGAGGVLSGALGEVIAMQPTPFDDWGDLMKYLADFRKPLLTAVSNYAIKTLSDIPSNDAHYWYNQDPQSLTQIFSQGAFVVPPVVPAVPDSILASYTSVAINYLWDASKVFIIKINKDSYGHDVCGSGGPSVYSKQTWCDDQGNAYIFQTWTYVSSANGAPGPTMFHTVDEVPGYDHLGDDEYGKITLQDVALASEFSNTKAKPGQAPSGQQIVDNIMSDPTKVTADKLVSFSLGVCDLNAIIKANPDWNLCKNLPGGMTEETVRPLFFLILQSLFHCLSATGFTPSPIQLHSPSLSSILYIHIQLQTR
ncbi:MAG: hypothetical protein Q9227_009550 [Pyrenula ochraceoflavens]